MFGALTMSAVEFVVDWSQEINGGVIRYQAGTSSVCAAEVGICIKPGSPSHHRLRGTSAGRPSSKCDASSHAQALSVTGGCSTVTHAAQHVRSRSPLPLPPEPDT